MSLSLHVIMKPYMFMIMLNGNKRCKMSWTISIRMKNKWYKRVYRNNPNTRIGHPTLWGVRKYKKNMYLHNWWKYAKNTMCLRRLNNNFESSFCCTWMQDIMISKAFLSFSQFYQLQQPLLWPPWASLPVGPVLVPPP